MGDGGGAVPEGGDGGGEVGEGSEGGGVVGGVARGLVEEAVQHAVYETVRMALREEEGEGEGMDCETITTEIGGSPHHSQQNTTEAQRQVEMKR